MRYVLMVFVTILLSSCDQAPSNLKNTIDETDIKKINVTDSDFGTPTEPTLKCPADTHVGDTETSYTPVPQSFSCSYNVCGQPRTGEVNKNGHREDEYTCSARGWVLSGRGATGYVVWVKDGCKDNGTINTVCESGKEETFTKKLPDVKRCVGNLDSNGIDIDIFCPGDLDLDLDFGLR